MKFKKPSQLWRKGECWCFQILVCFLARRKKKKREGNACVSVFVCLCTCLCAYAWCRISKNPYLKLLGDPEAACVSFTTDGSFDVYPIADAMAKRGWENLVRLQKPVGLMTQVGARRSFNVDDFLKCLNGSLHFLLHCDTTHMLYTWTNVYFVVCQSSFWL